ncbi:hypothetical protein SNE40_020649 [Patella caerulea]|uniref:Uncharacterized protein n=1 Tax=Patella caerulea TaxID=87958 RepID=A0AAN8PBF9_PATCE
MCSIINDSTIRVGNDQNMKAGDLIDEIEKVTGFMSVVVCVPMYGYFEVSFDDVDKLGLLTTQEITIDGKTVNHSVLGSKIRIVSFMHIPHYIEDSEIYDKLDSWGVEARSEIRRRHFAHGERKIPDGTRYLKVLFSLTLMRKSIVINMLCMSILCYPLGS